MIPVFILAAAASGYWRNRHGSPWHVNTMLVGVVLVALAGEMSALDALQFHRNGSAFEDSLVSMALGFPAFFVFVLLVAEPLAALMRDLPSWLRKWGSRLAGPIVATAIVMFFSFGVDPVLFVAVAGIVCILGPNIALLLRPSWEAERGDSPEPQGGTSSALPPSAREAKPGNSLDA